ncbi:MAG: phage holin family protein [Candidatus Nanopelagicales bacterium]|nr:phage holin family protein [Candidatus Nanopelagicales bacterium]
MTTDNDVTHDEASTAELVGRITENLSALFRKEIELAKAETKAEAVKAGMGAGMLAAAGVLSLIILGLVSMAGAQWLSNEMDLQWAYLTVAGIWLVIAVILALVGRSKLRTLNPVPERTAETLREIPDAVRGR